MTRINIQPDELQLAAGVLSLQNIFEIKYSAPVRLYHAKSNSSNWSYANSYGILTVTVLEKQSVVMIRLVDLKSKSVTMEQECYENFEYQTLSSNFHAFESDDGFVGLLFAERFDADQFAKQVCQLIRLKATGSINGGTPPPSLPNSTKPTVAKSDSYDTSPTNAPPTPVKRINNPPPSTPPPKVNTVPTVTSTPSIASSSSVNTHTVPEKKHTTSNSGGNSGSSGGGFLSKIFGGKKEQIPDRSQIKISGPKVDKFKHVSHIGFDPKQGFTEIPPELKSVFEKAGISEAELKDKKTAKFLMKTLVAVTSDAPTMDVPPVPTGGRPQPPPTPGTRSTPPPPPFKGGTTSASTASGSSAIGVGGFVPPPPTNVPPPPVVDHSIKPRVSVASPATDSDGGSGGIDMLAEIKNKKLRNVKQEDLPEFKNMAESDQNNLAAKIAGIMELRRGNIEYSSEDDESEDDDWEL